MTCFEATNSLCKPKHKQSDISTNVQSKSRLSIIMQQIAEKDTEANNKNQTEFNIRFQCNTTHITEEDSKILLLLLQNHFLFKKIPLSFLQKIIDSNLKYYQIDENKIIFNEGDECDFMVIVLKGKCELFKKGIDQSLLYTPFTTFGELALINNNTFRTYSARTKIKVTICCVFPCEWSNFIKENPNEESDIDINSSIIGDIPKVLESVPFFSFLEEEEKESISKFAYKLHLQEKTKGYKLKESFFLVQNGKIECRDINNKFELEMKQNMYFGIQNLLLNITPTLILSNSEGCCLYIIPQKAFIETLGIDYTYHLVYPYFKHLFSRNCLFSIMFNELQLGPVYKIFKMKRFLQNQLVYSKGTKGKIIIVLEGELDVVSNNNNVDLRITAGEIYGDKMVKSKVEMDDDVIAKYNTIILETEWDEMKKKITSFNSSLNKKIKKLSMMDIMIGVCEMTLLEIASVIKKETYYKGDVIIPKGEKGDKGEKEEKFYMVIKGECKLRNKGKTIGRFGKGNAFGELDILNIQDANDEIVASSVKTVLYTIEKKYFLSLMEEAYFNDYISRKLCNEDKEIVLNDIKVVNKINNETLMVHNSMENFILKLIIKKKENKERVVNRIKLNRKIDHPFVIKLVKFLENEKFCFLLYQFNSNIVSLSTYYKTYCENNNNNTNINDIINFCSICIFITIDFIHSKKFIHRNLTLDSILLDQYGYIKLINFDYSKNIKKTLKTKSIVNISHYSSPEILSGKEYSFSSDYWSIGVCLYYLYYGNFPFALAKGKNLNDPMEIYRNVMNSFLVLSKCEFNLKELLSSLLNKNPKKRIASLAHIKEMKMYRDVDFDMYLARKVKSPFSERIKEENCTKKKEVKEILLEYYVKSIKYNNDNFQKDNININWTGIF